MLYAEVSCDEQTGHLQRHSTTRRRLFRQPSVLQRQRQCDSFFFHTALQNNGGGSFSVGNMSFSPPAADPTTGLDHDGPRHDRRRQTPPPVTIRAHRHDHHPPTLTSSWDDDDVTVYVDETTGQKFHPTTSPWNAHGVVHVRLVSARRLPCPIGSSVRATVSLPPYKGKVRSKRKNAFLGSLDHGVCVRWGENRDGDDHQDFLDDDSKLFLDNNNDDDDDADGLCSMVNGWSSEESPVPTIQIHLMFSPLAMGLFDFTMASVELSCHVLLRHAGVWRSRWVAMDVPSSSANAATSMQQSSSGLDNRYHEHMDRIPLLHVQAVFVPSVPSDATSIALSGVSGASASRTSSSIPPAIATTSSTNAMTNIVPNATGTGDDATSPLGKTMLVPSATNDDLHAWTESDASVRSRSPASAAQVHNANHPSDHDIKQDYKRQEVETGMAEAGSSSAIDAKTETSHHHIVGDNTLPAHLSDDDTNGNSSVMAKTLDGKHQKEASRCDTTASVPAATIPGENDEDDEMESVDMNDHDPSEEDEEPTRKANEASLAHTATLLSKENARIDGSTKAPRTAVVDVPPTPTDDDISDVMSLASKTVQTTVALQPHLLRAENYWVPTHTCAVCSRMLFGRKGGFHCEACGIDCCGDCRLNVDLRVPCGSDKAQEIVEKSFGSKMHLSNLLSMVAPDEAFEQQKIAEESMHMPGRDSLSTAAGAGWNRKSLSTTLGGSPEGIGQLRLEIVRACLFEEHLSPHELVPLVDSAISLPKMRNGDYYVRVSATGSDKSTRTPALQNTGMPHFHAPEMRLPLAHYGMQFRLDVVDANTESVFGSTVLTTQGILQEQRDLYISKHGASIFQFMQGPIPWEGTRNRKLELRAGIKGASIHDFFSVPSKSSGGPKDKNGGSVPGAISGWIEVNVGVEEFLRQLYGSRPIECPARPPADFHIATFNGHIARITSLIADVKLFIADLTYMVSWKNPALTSLCLIVFVTFCIQFNAEYSGSLPFLFLLALSLYCALHRGRGAAKTRYIQREVEAIQQAEKSSVGYTFYRPRGTLHVTVSKGRNLISRDFGIAGTVSCSVYWDALRFADDGTKKKLVKSDKAAKSPIEIGSTSSIYTANPDWAEMIESVDTKRLKQILPSSEKEFFDCDDLLDTAAGEERKYLGFPILQPFEIKGASRDDKGRFKDGELKAWESSKGAIIMQVKFQDFLNNLPGFDQFLGEVACPFSELIKNGEIKGWFQLLDVGTTMIVPCDDYDLEGNGTLDGTTGPPRIYLHLKWTPPASNSISDPEESEREVSYVIQEELVRSSALSKSRKFDLVGSSIGAVNTAFGLGSTVQMVQNSLGSILDIVEAGINAFNFTDPFKSSIIFVALFVVWVVLIVVPTRYLVLTAGLVPYVVGFVEQFGEDLGFKKPKKAGGKQDAFLDNFEGGPEEKKQSSSSVAIWIDNALKSLPTNDDLRKAYFWESRRLGAQQTEVLASEKRESRLDKLWKATWHSHVKIHTSGRATSPSHPLWQACFAVIQGHRFLWWHTVEDFDNGELPAGRLFLSGHAGLGTPSPLEMRELSKEELNLCLSLFGRGERGQERVTMLLPDATTKEGIAKAVTDSAVFKKD